MDAADAQLDDGAAEVGGGATPRSGVEILSKFAAISQMNMCRPLLNPPSSMPASMEDMAIRRFSLATSSRQRQHQQLEEAPRPAVLVVDDLLLNRVIIGSMLRKVRRGAVGMLWRVMLTWNVVASEKQPKAKRVGCAQEEYAAGRRSPAPAATASLQAHAQKPSAWKLGKQNL